MRIRFSLELRIERQPEAEPPQFEHRDNDTLIESRPQPGYIGFRPDDGR